MADERERPKLEDLEPVSDADFVFRVVGSDYYNAGDLQGRPVQRGAFPIAEFKGSEFSYGASVFVESRLAGGVTDLFTVNAGWAANVILRLPVVDMKRFNIAVHLSPLDCDFPALTHAHASLTNTTITRSVRGELLLWTQSLIWYKPE